MSYIVWFKYSFLCRKWFVRAVNGFFSCILSVASSLFASASVDSWKLLANRSGSNNESASIRLLAPFDGKIGHLEHSLDETKLKLWMCAHTPPVLHRDLDQGNGTPLSGEQPRLVNSPHTAELNIKWGGEGMKSNACWNRRQYQLSSAKGDFDDIVLPSAASSSCAETGRLDAVKNCSKSAKENR